MVVLLVLLGCAHTVTVVANPAGATLRVDGRRVGVSPAEVVVRPFRPVTVSAAHPGYRPLDVRVRAGARDRTLELRLVEDHGGVGSE